MATIKKKPTKAHKSKKVVKAHQGMAHVPRPKQRPTAPAFAKDAVRKAQEQMIKRGPIAPTTTTTDTVSKPTRRPTLSGRRATTDVLRPTKSVVDPSKRRPLTKAEKDQGIRYANPTGTLASFPNPKPTRRPTRVPQESMTGSDGSVYPAVKPMDERARRRRDNALKSEVDEMTRRFNRQQPRRPRRPTERAGFDTTVQPIRQPRPIRLPNDFGGRKPRQNSMDLGPLPNNFNPLESTALTDRFNKLNQNNLNQNRLQMQRNKGGDIKKYATGGLNKGMTKSRTKYGTVDNKKK